MEKLSGSENGLLLYFQRCVTCSSYLCRQRQSWEYVLADYAGLDLELILLLDEELIKYGLEEDVW